MCGIIGIVSKNKKNLTPVLIGALSRLEYRGYDSAGIAISHDKLVLHKCVGAPSENLHETDIRVDGKEVLSYSGIGHNRWATHGKPSIQNAHPHIDTKNRIAVVHNGVILNYEFLKNDLIKKGIVFKSDTDTEVVPHLISSFLDAGMSMEDSFVKSVKMLEGAFGIVAVDNTDPTKLYVAKEGSPMVIGMTEDTYYAASSIHGFAVYTSTFSSLRDGEIAVLSSSPILDIRLISIYDNTDRDIEFEELKDYRLEESEKGDFETFMLKEIFEQPSTVQATMAGRLNIDQGTAVLGGLFDYEEILRRTENILMIGCGTAYNAGEVGAYLIEDISSLSVRTEIASEGRYKNIHTSTEDTSVFAVSQSGETSDTIEYLKELNRKGFNTFGIVNVVGSAISEITGKGVYTKAGHEIGVASTKAFTAQLLVIYLVALYMARLKGMSLNMGMKFINNFEQVPKLMSECLEESESIRMLADKYSSFNKIQFLGRGIHVPIAKEAALKFKELTYIETGAYPLGELKHGPIAIIDEESLSIVILPDDEFFEQGVGSIEQIKSKGGSVILLTNTGKKDHHICKKVEEVIYIPDIENPLFYPFLEIIPLQLFAYHFANKLGKNIDKPRNLAKSVTVQ